MKFIYPFLENRHPSALCHYKASVTILNPLGSQLFKRSYCRTHLHIWSYFSLQDIQRYDNG